jgi:murein DD-endopeptidase MepM/ murein hydrolase activator NlpD
MKRYNRFKHIFSQVTNRVADRVYIALLRLDMQRKGVFAQSSWLSLTLRPILETEGVRVRLAAPVAAFMIVGGVSQLPDTSYTLTTWEVSDPIASLIDYNAPISLETKQALMLPVETLYGVSQTYHSGHPGIDLRAPLGSAVRAIRDGVVVETEHSNVGYGNKVVVDHADDQQTLYAHLDEILVVPGMPVRVGEKLGTVGLTGWSTGPHLHFEVRENERVINPLWVLQPALESYQRLLVAAKDQSANVFTGDSTL